MVYCIKKDSYKATQYDGKNLDEIVQHLRTLAIKIEISIEEDRSIYLNGIPGFGTGIYLEGIPLEVSDWIISEGGTFIDIYSDTNFNTSYKIVPESFLK